METTNNSISNTCFLCKTPSTTICEKCERDLCSKCKDNSYECIKCH